LKNSEFFAGNSEFLLELPSCRFVGSSGIVSFAGCVCLIKVTRSGRQKLAVVQKLRRFRPGSAGRCGIDRDCKSARISAPAKITNIVTTAAETRMESMGMVTSVDADAACRSAAKRF
jgi:hypothetical protein